MAVTVRVVLSPQGYELAMRSSWLASNAELFRQRPFGRKGSVYEAHLGPDTALAVAHELEGLVARLSSVRERHALLGPAMRIRADYGLIDG